LILFDINFKKLTAKDHEIITEGGEEQFLLKMIDESFEIRDKCGIFTTLLGKKKTLKEVKKRLEAFRSELLSRENRITIKIETTTFYQGKTLRYSLRCYITCVDGESHGSI